MRVMPAKDSRFVRKLYLIVTQEDAALVSWTPDGRAFTIHDTAGFQRAIKTKHHLSSLCTFRQNLRAHGFAEIEIGSSAAHDDISGGVSNNGSDVSVGNDAAAGRAPRSKTRGGSRSSDIVESSDSSTCSEDDDYDYERSSNSNARRKSDAVSAAMHSASHSSAQLPSPQAQASSALSASSSSAPPPETYFHPFFVRGHPELLERITFDASLKYRCQECKRHPNESGAKCSFRRRDASGASAARMPVSMSEWAPTSASVTATASKALVHSMSSGASAGASGVGNSSGTGSTLGSDSWSSSVASSSSSGMPQSATIGSSSLVVKLQAPRHHLDKNAALLAPSEPDTRAAALPAPGSRGSTSTNTSMLSFASAFLRPSPSLLGAPASESAPSECQRQPAQTRGFVSQSTGSQTPAATSGAGSGSLVVRLSFGGRRDDSSSSNDGSRDGDRDAHTGAAVEATREAAHRRVDEATRDVRTISGAGASVGDGCKRLHNPTLPPDPPRTSGREQQQPSAPERFPFPLDIMNPAKPHRDGNDDSGDGDGESHGYSVSGATDVSCSGSSGDCRSHYAYEEEQDDQQPHHHDKHHQQQQSHQSHRQEQSQQSQRVVSARRNGTGIFKSQRLQAKTTNAVATKTMAKTVATKIVTATAETESKTVTMLSLPPPPSTVPSRRQSVEPASAAPTSAAPHTVLQTVSKRVEPVLLAIPKARSAPAGSTARAPLSTAAATKQLADLTLVPSVAPPMRITLSLGGARRHRRERQEHGGESRSGAQPMASVESVEPLRSGKRATSVDSAEMRGAPQPNASRKRARTSPAAASFPTLVTATATTPGAGDLRFSIKLPPSSASVERQPLARRGVAMASESSGSTEPSGAAASRGRGRALAHKLMPDEDGAAGGAVGEAVAETAVSVTPTPSAGSLSFRVKLPGRTSVANSSSNTIGNDRKRGGGGTDAHADSASERVGSKRLRGVCVAAALSPGSGSTPTLTPAPTDARVSQPRTQASRSKSLQARLVAKTGAVSGGTEDANALSLLVLASVKRQ